MPTAAFSRSTTIAPFRSSNLPPRHQRGRVHELRPGQRLSDLVCTKTQILARQENLPQCANESPRPTVTPSVCSHRTSGMPHTPHPTKTKNRLAHSSHLSSAHQRLIPAPSSPPCHTFLYSDGLMFERWKSSLHSHYSVIQLCGASASAPSTESWMTGTLPSVPSFHPLTIVNWRILCGVQD